MKILIISLLFIQTSYGQLLNLRSSKKSNKSSLSSSTKTTKETKKIENATDVNPQEIESKFTKDPELTGISTDQAQADQIIKYANNKQQEMNDNHVLKMHSCKKLKVMSEIEDCQKKILESK